MKNQTARAVELVKWSLTILFFAIGVYLSILNQSSALIRVASVLVPMTLSLWFFSGTHVGGQLKQFLIESRQEIRKVVWPSKQETLQVTAVVLFIVAVTALVLWATDSLIMKIIGWLTGYAGV